MTIDGPWFYAEVCDTPLMANWFNSPTVRQQVGLDWNGFLEVAGPVHIVCYYFLFPRHLEVRTLARADGSLEPAASYEGDWACFCVVTRPVDDLPGNDIPLMAGFSRRRRGASGDFGGEFIQEYMELVPWDQVPAAGGHAGVKVAQGTHNLYTMDSDQGQPGGVRPQDLDFGSGASESGNKIVGGSVQSPAGAASGAVTLAKVLVGLAAAGPLGALIGAVAAGAEAAEIHEGLHEEPELEPGDGSPPEWPDDLQDPRDGLQETSASHVIVPQRQEGLIQALTGAAGAAAVSFWMEDGERTIVDRTQQLFWTDQIVANHGYKGRWGVRCSDDPFNRRAGGKFPEFRLQVLQQLVVVI